MKTNSYAAFISYSHRDSKWAAWLQRALESYRLPKQVAKANGLARRLNPIFRDREELTAGANLGEHLIEALDQSDALIVVCSPHSAQSQWVCAEIEYFKSLGKADRIFSLLVEGGSESFPAPLLSDASGGTLEPLAADPRDHADRKRLAKLKLVAGLLDLPLDQLAQRDRRRQRQLNMLFASATLVFLLLGLGAYWNWQQQQREAEATVRLVRFVSDKWDDLRTVGLPLDLILSLAEEPLAYLEEKGTDNLKRKGLEAFAILLRQQGIAYMDQNNPVAALRALEQSRTLFVQVSEGDPTQPELLFERALAEYWVGEIKTVSGDYLGSAPFLTAYADIMQSLHQLQPDSPLYAEELIFSTTHLLRLKENEPSALPDIALDEQVRTTLQLAENGLAQFPDSIGMLTAHWSALAHVATFYDSTCDIKSSLPIILRAYLSANKTIALETQQYGSAGLETVKDAGAMASWLGKAYASNGNTGEATRYLLRAHELRSQVVSQDPTNAYLGKRLFENKLDLFRLSFLARDFGTLSAHAELFVVDLPSEVGRQAARGFDLEEAWLQVMAERALIHGEYEVAQVLVQELVAKLEGKARDSVIRHFWALTHWLAVNRSAQIKTFPLQAQPSGGGNCRDRFSLWSWHLANGNTQEAHAVARALWEKGYRHPRMAFYAKLAGTSYPPEGVTSP